MFILNKFHFHGFLMLEQISIENFKSLRNIGNLKLPQLAILFGPNAAGKSNFLDAIKVLSGVATEKSLIDGFNRIRGRTFEAFSFPPGGLIDLFKNDKNSVAFDTVLHSHGDKYTYKIEIGVDLKSGQLRVLNEFLGNITKRNDRIKGNPIIEKENGQLLIRRKGRQRKENIGEGFSILSDARYSGNAYPSVEKCRSEFRGWRSYYLDPAFAMRQESSPSEVHDIGVLGQSLLQFLYRVKNTKPKLFDSIIRTIKSLIPSVDDIIIQLNTYNGSIELFIKQNGVEYSHRVVSEGTLRILALCAIAINPWSGSLISFEEPENGVHPRRLELVAELLTSMCLQRSKQLIVTTHSPLFCSEMLRKSAEYPGKIGLFNVKMGDNGTIIEPFDKYMPLLNDKEIKDLLKSSEEDGVFEGLLLRGLIDE